MSRAARGIAPVCAIAIIGGLAMPVPAYTQTSKNNDSAASAKVEDIVVTARKKTERLIDVPVAVSTLTAKALARYSTSSFQSIATQTPELIIGETPTQTGGSANLRGIGSGASNPTSEQPITISVDNVAVSQGQIMRLSQYDLESVEVLKGPQTLLFGKNSPAGVISLRSADPGKEFFAQLRTGYEFYNSQKFGEAIISGPLGGGFGARVVGYYSGQDGWFRNAAVAVPGVVDPGNYRGLDQTNEFGRLTLTYSSPSGDLTGRFKFNYENIDRKNGTQVGDERYACPNGTPQLNIHASNCTVGRYYNDTNLSPAIVATDPASFGSGQQYFKDKQILSSLDLTYHPASDVALTSVTGYYFARENYQDCFTGAELCLLAARSDYRIRQFTEEARLQSEFDGPFNVLAGVFYQDSKITDNIPLAFGPGIFGPAAIEFPITDYAQKTHAISGFGQLSFKPTTTIDMSIGGRYSHEIKGLGGTYGGGSAQLPFLNISTLIADPSRKFNNFSPEATITYKPSHDVTAYASYRTGFVSGGFNTTAIQAFGPQPPDGHLPNPGFTQTTVKGGELGLKGFAVDHQLRADLTLYYYKYKGLQVNAFDPVSSAITTLNAAAATVRGVEINTVYRPSVVKGLELRAGAAYNDAYYNKYDTADCYPGQTIAEGCTGDLIAGAFTTQNLSGRVLQRAPKFDINGGLTYERDLGQSMTGSINIDAKYLSKYETEGEEDPRSAQKGYATIDGALSLQRADGGWQVSLIGRNLTNQLPITITNAAPLTGGGTGTAQGVLPDLNGNVAQPRSVLVQLILKSSLLQRQ